MLQILFAIKKLLQFCQCQADFKFNLFHTKVSSSLSSLKGDCIYCTREKVSCHSLTMQCYYTRNNLMGSAFKTEMPQGKLPIHPGQESQRYSSSYLEKCKETPRMESTLVIKVTGPRVFSRMTSCLPQREIWATLVCRENRLMSSSSI